MPPGKRGDVLESEPYWSKTLNKGSLKGFAPSKHCFPLSFEGERY